ncbi:hypothetical protein [Streptosporangium subroseum]|uniref:hypothetical protein n=1 Tax=Streptosporangium subroseum TaxID=106412 RepID=UPI001180FB45|nr:hypothetical protein [Streptosporangium subroseum]
MSTRLANGVTKAVAKPFQFRIVNFGGAKARAVTVTVDVSKLDKTRVGYVVPNGCIANATGYTCKLGDMPDFTHNIGVPLYSLGEEGPAGTLSVKVAGTTPDPYLDDNSAEVPVTVTTAGYDLVPWAQDVYADVVVDRDDTGETDLTPVKAGHSAVLDWAIYNYGSRPAEGSIRYGFTLPVGVTFAKQPIGCHTAVVNGQTVANCETPYITLQPGKSFATPMNVKVGGNGTSTVINGASFYVDGPTPEDVDQDDADTYFEAFTRG